MRKITYIILTLLLPCTYRASAQQDVVVSKYENQKELTATNSIRFTDGFSVTEGASFHAYISPQAMRIGTKIKGTMNAIVTYTAKQPGIVNLLDTNNTVNQVSVEVQTLDNFGRVKEIQQVKATPGFNDLIQLKQYDAIGHETIKYLPYVQPKGQTNFSSLGYVSLTTGFYSGLDNTYATIATGNPFSEVKYDNSPLERVMETSSPGTDFSMASHHTVRTSMIDVKDNIPKYLVNGDALARPSTTGFEYYSGPQLTMTRIEDENVAPHSEFTDPDSSQYNYNISGAVYEYKNYLGQVILKRIVKSDGSGGFERFSTYYVYDNLGNLRFVIPPSVSADGAAVPSQNVLDNLCYQYKYDNQQRMIAKKLPGKGWEFLVYDRNDRVVMSQDAVQRGKASQEWKFTKYDVQGRPVIAGIFTQAGSTPGTDYRVAMQTSVYLQGLDYETRINTGNGYTNNTYPKTWGTTLSLNFYDDYNFPSGNPYPYSAPEVSNMTRGMATASLINVLGTGDMLWSVNYVDGEGRAIRSFKQHYKGTTLVANNYDEVTNTFDFSSALLTSMRSHNVAGTEILRTLNEYTYDHMGRKVNIWETINNGYRVLIAQNQYDELGMLFKKNLHSTNDGTSFLQTTSYKYNERSWLTRAQALKLDFSLKYNQPIHGAGAQYNGNIAEMEYTGQYSGNKWFTYSYDVLNRLTYSSSSGTGDLSEVIAYDKTGNITSLKRGVSSNNATIYTYANSGVSNQLFSTTGPVAGSYSYDLNGNAVTDSRRALTLTYNQLNLPITVTGIQNASYLYDAAGTKLKSVQGANTREYINGIQYNTSGAIDFITTEEGRAVRNAGDGSYKYEYYLKDHLGNVRVTIDENGSSARVTQENEYYAFGLSVPRFSLGGIENKDLYNGKEKQEILTDEYDYGARFYDPVIARWNTIDPLAEKYRRWSSYNFCIDNPIRFVDPDGMAVNVGSNGGITVTGADMSGLYSQYARFVTDRNEKKKQEQEQKEKEKQKQLKKEYLSYIVRPNGIKEYVIDIKKGTKQLGTTSITTEVLNLDNTEFLGNNEKNETGYKDASTQIARYGGWLGGGLLGGSLNLLKVPATPAWAIGLLYGGYAQLYSERASELAGEFEKIKDDYNSTRKTGMIIVSTRILYSDSFGIPYENVKIEMYIPNGKLFKTLNYTQ